MLFQPRLILLMRHRAELQCFESPYFLFFCPVLFFFFILVDSRFHAFQHEAIVENSSLRKGDSLTFAHRKVNKIQFVRIRIPYICSLQLSNLVVKVLQDSVYSFSTFSLIIIAYKKGLVN